MSRKSLLLVAATLVALGACGGGSDSGGGGRAVEITAVDFAFEPSTLELEPGEEVELTVVNEGEAPHTFTSEDLGVDVEVEPGESASATFTAPEEGAVAFHCHFHEDDMVGEITVDGSSVEGDTGHETDGHEDGGEETEEPEDEGETDTGKY